MFSYKPTDRTPGLLDGMRMNTGVDNLKSTFHSLVQADPNNAVLLLNDENISFTSLHALHPIIKKNGLSPYLNNKCKCALDISQNILAKKSPDYIRASTEFNRDDYPVLKWIIETGYVNDGLDIHHDTVLECAAIMLTKVYKDNSCLNPMLEMIYNRNRKEFFIYDLVWAFFEARNPKSLLLIADRLLSDNPKDVELSRKLLDFIPSLNTSYGIDNKRLHKYATKWIKDNLDFLQYTGETFQQTNKPRQYVVSLEAKYLQKPVLDERESENRMETELPEGFSSLDRDMKLLLSYCSSLLFKENINQWRVWMNYPLKKQITLAQYLLGG